METNTIGGVVSFTLSSIPEYNDETFKGFRIKYQAEEYNKSEIIVRLQTSNQTSIVRSMKATQEIGNRHPLLAGELQ